MTLGKDASIVADSTISSSPAQTADASPHIKRATRTYGKRREEPLADEIADSVWYATSSWGNIHKTAPPGLTETIPASSPEKIPVDPDTFDATTRDDKLGRHNNAGQTEQNLWESDSQFEQEDFLFKSSRTEKAKAIDRSISENGDSPSRQTNSLMKDSFGWKEKMNEIDKIFENDVSRSTPTPDKSEHFPSFGKAMLLQEVNPIQLESTIARALSPALFVSDDVFNGPPSSSLDVQSSFSLSSPPAPHRRSRRSKRQVVRDSDSEEELQKGSSSAAPSTSGNNSFFSAKSRSSSTQPTSDEDMPVNQNLSRRKPDSSRVSFPPLDFTELSSKDEKRGRKGKQTRVKAPTKKELRETVKERSRLAAQARVTVPRAEVSSKYTVENLLKIVSGQQNRSQPSDPIEPFTSPITTASPKESAHSNPVSLLLSERIASAALDNPDDSEDELPEITELLQEDTKRRHAEELKKMKQQALEQQTALVSDNEDDDLIISTDPKTTIKDEEENRRSKQSKRSKAQKTVARLAHINLVAPAKKPSVISPTQIRKDFPFEIAASGSGTKLQRIMFAQAQEHASREIKRKEEEWTKHGGHLAQRPVAPKGFESAVKAIADKGLETVDAQIFNCIEAESDNDEGDNWRPEGRESASPGTNDENHYSESRGTMVVDEETTISAGEQEDDTDVDDRKVRMSRRNLVLSESDDEDGSAARVTRRASTSSGLATEDEYDKENNTRLMYDQGEDKENKKVVRHTSVSTRYTIFDVTHGSLSSPEASNPNVSLDDANSTRRPFQELLSEASPRAKSFSASSSFVSKLQQASPLASTLAPAPMLKPFLSEYNGFSGFSQFSQVEPFGTEPPLQPGFSELFEPSTGKRKSPLNLSKDRFEELISDENRNSTQLKRSDILYLTQDVAAAIQLQPAFQAEDVLVRKAEAIFEKEQGFVVEANGKKLDRQRTELYVNELGFLTQTRPLEGTPEVYRRMSPVNSTLKSQTETPSQRMPLQTLSLSSPSQFESPRQEPLHRLRRVVDISPQTRIRSPSASPPVCRMRQLNAHEELRRGQQAQQRREEKNRKRAELGILYEDEAAESDDDDMFGFVRKPADDEADGEDLDQNLPGLVDDQKMDADTEGMYLVLDKYKEHVEEDDKKLEELHQAAVQGQLRQKRNRGVGIDDSDDDSDVGDNERARRAMKRARKSDRTDIKGLEANDETRAFADSYNQCLREDDEDDFAFLEKQHDVGDVVAEYSDGEDEDENDEMLDNSVDASELRKEIQDEVREGHLEKGMVNTNDISWLEVDEEMEDLPRVKRVDTRQGLASRLDVPDLETIIPFRKSPTRMNQTSKQWFTVESKTRNASTVRKNGGLAVTGQKRRETVVNKGHSLGKPSAAGRQVKAAASALSIIADRSSNFA